MKDQATNVLRVLVVIIGNIAFLLALAFAFLGNVPSGIGVDNVTMDSQTDLFIQDVESLGDKYSSEINPAAWAFVIIWPVIFFWNLIGSCYMTVSLCLPLDKSPVKRYPALIPISFLILWIFNWTSTIGWLFSYDREYFGVALFCLIFTAVTGYMMLGLSYKSYFPDILILEEDSKVMLWLVRILIHNGFAIYVTWITCAWKLNLATVITYQYGMNQPTPAPFNGAVNSETAGIISLAVLLTEIVVWFVLENFVFEKYCRYTLTIYPTLIYTLSAIFVKNYVYPFSTIIIITIAGMALTSVMFLFRIAFVIYRHRTRMMYRA